MLKQISAAVLLMAGAVMPAAAATQTYQFWVYGDTRPDALGSISVAGAQLAGHYGIIGTGSITADSALATNSWASVTGFSLTVGPYAFAVDPGTPTPQTFNINQSNINTVLTTGDANDYNFIGFDPTVPVFNSSLSTVPGFAGSFNFRLAAVDLNLGGFAFDARVPGSDLGSGSLSLYRFGAADPSFSNPPFPNGNGNVSFHYDYISFTAPVVAAVPEPSSVVLALAGLGVLVASARRRRSAKTA